MFCRSSKSLTNNKATYLITIGFTFTDNCKQSYLDDLLRQQNSWGGKPIHSLINNVLQNWIPRQHRLKLNKICLHLRLRYVRLIQNIHSPQIFTQKYIREEGRASWTNLCKANMYLKRTTILSNVLLVETSAALQPPVIFTHFYNLTKQVNSWRSMKFTLQMYKISRLPPFNCMDF